MRGDYLGEFEELVLLAIRRSAGHAYGMHVRRELAERTGRDVSIGAVYTTVDRLLDKGFVRSVDVEPHPDRDGRARRFFELTSAGVAALAAADRMRAQLRAPLKPKRAR